MLYRTWSLCPSVHAAVPSSSTQMNCIALDMLVSASFPGEMSKLGKIGGKARAASLSPERRKEIAQNAVAARNAKRNAKKTQKPNTNTELLSNP